MTAYLDELHHIVELRRDGGAVTGVTTGIRTLDVFTGRLQPSDLIVLCARPAIGKTSLAINMACHAMAKGKSVLFFSLEMSRKQVWQRILADETGIDQTRLRSGWFGFDDEAKIDAAYNTLMQSPGLLTVDDTSGLNPLQMRSITRRKQSELSDGVDLVIIDYLQMVHATEKQERRDLDIGSVTKSLKGMAKELNIPVLALAQLSRSAEGVEPQLSHLAESGAIEMDSDLVMGMWVTPDQVELKKQNASSYNTELIIMKHRNGPVGGVTLTFTPGVTRFEEYGAVKE
jgi:replicative DNA helicase